MGSKILVRPRTKKIGRVLPTIKFWCDRRPKPCIQVTLIFGATPDQKNLGPVLPTTPNYYYHIR